MWYRASEDWPQHKRQQEKNAVLLCCILSAPNFSGDFVSASLPDFLFLTLLFLISASFSLRWGISGLEKKEKANALLVFFFLCGRDGAGPVTSALKSARLSLWAEEKGQSIAAPFVGINSFVLFFFKKCLFLTSWFCRPKGATESRCRPRWEGTPRSLAACRNRVYKGR